LRKWSVGVIREMECWSNGVMGRKAKPAVMRSSGPMDMGGEGNGVVTKLLE
jgi:hypothetical protein